MSMFKIILVNFNIINIWKHYQLCPLLLMPTQILSEYIEIHLSISMPSRSMNLDFAQPEVYVELASSFINECLYSSACQMLCFWLCVQETHPEGVYEKITKQKFGFFSLNEMPKSFVDE